MREPTLKEIAANSIRYWLGESATRASATNVTELARMARQGDALP
jgi:hypothetical protein